jgi:xylan 1,4-beta-xylosidase
MQPTFAIPELTKGCTQPHPDLCPFPSVGLKVANTGKTTSDFVALAFLAGRYGPAPYPIKTLAAYTRLRGIQPGQTSKGTLSITLGTLARTDLSGNLVLYPGDYELLLDVPTQSRLSFKLTGDELVLDRLPQPPPPNGTNAS